MNIVTPESIAVFCLTPGGIRLARQLQAHLPLTCYCSDKLLEAGFEPFVGNFAKTVAQAFHTHTALIVIGATGLTVRVIAPLLKDKLTDPAVVVIDERGRHVISLLSGHVGGANALTRYLAGVLGADPVITTATDVNELSALDTLAVQLDADMHDFRDSVKQVNHLLVSDGRVGLFWDHGSLPEPGDHWPVEQCDTRGFITVASLADLPANLDAGATPGGGRYRLSARHLVSTAGVATDPAVGEVPVRPLGPQGHRQRRAQGRRARIAAPVGLLPGAF